MDISRGPSRGFTFVELAIAVGIVMLLLAAATPFYNSYRGKSNVNRAIEVTKAVIERAAEEAKSSGYPLPQDLLKDGIETPAGNPVDNQRVVFRVLKRVTAEGPAKLIAERHIQGSEGLTLTLNGLGLLDLADTDAQGIFVEILQQEGQAETLLATIPVDVNGEFVFQGEEGVASIYFSYGSHAREIQMTARGVVTSDQR